MKKVIIIIALLVIFNPVHIIEGSKTDYIRNQAVKNIDPDRLVKTIEGAVINTQMAKDSIVFDGGSLDMVAAILSLVYIESTFKADAVNPKSGCTGLMQMEKATYMSMVRTGMVAGNKWDQIKDPYYNVLIGILWLDYTYRLVKKALPKLSSGEVFKISLAAYNKGATVTIREIKSTGIIPKYKYVNKFRNAYRTVRKYS